eukprot:g2274.t1
MLQRISTFVAPLPDCDKDLMDAAFEGNLILCRSAIHRGADVNKRAKESNNGPVHVAAYHGKINILRELIDAGADVRAQGRAGNTALHFSARRGHVDIVRFLLSSTYAGLANVRNSAGDAPIHHATLGCRAACVHQLIKAGADVNIKGKFGCTPLHCSAMRNSLSIAKMLIDAKADHLLRNKMKQTPKDIATSTEMRKLFEEASVSRCEWLSSSSSSSEAKETPKNPVVRFPFGKFTGDDAEAGVARIGPADAAVGSKINKKRSSAVFVPKDYCSSLLLDVKRGSDASATSRFVQTVERSIAKIANPMLKEMRQEVKKQKKKKEKANTEAEEETPSTSSLLWRREDEFAIVVNDSKVLERECLRITECSSELEMPYGGVTKNELLRRKALGRRVRVRDVDERNMIARVELVDAGGDLTY